MLCLCCLTPHVLCLFHLDTSLALLSCILSSQAALFMPSAGNYSLESQCLMYSILSYWTGDRLEMPKSESLVETLDKDLTWNG